MKILFFSTGSNMRSYLHKKVKNQAADSDMIFGSTCTNTITVPKSLKRKMKRRHFSNVYFTLYFLFLRILEDNDEYRLPSNFIRFLCVG